ncbi:uncharacterized protein C2845_PM11G08320 [Panicum miliaceum]|uniref:Uncharacterized protein n=1 Tax=Panicum miliaceum TaxID=4540 RepID=A0A3L6RV58_PANMI|nr:uncharacterized protein C2845_PM11G08320 [Panicum miliaceum]
MASCRPSSRIRRCRRAHGGGVGFTVMHLVCQNDTPEDYGQCISDDPTTKSQQFVVVGGEGPEGGLSCRWIHGCTSRPLPAELQAIGSGASNPAPWSERVFVASVGSSTAIHPFPRLAADIHTRRPHTARRFPSHQRAPPPARRHADPGAVGGARPPPHRGDLAIRNGGGPRTYPGGVSKWQWKRMQAKKARQLLKARLARERQLYEMRKRTELRDAVAHLERPWDPDSAADASAVAPNLLSVAAEDQLRALADRFHRPGGVDLWNDRDGPRVFASPATGAASARFFPKNAVHSVQP